MALDSNGSDCRFVGGEAPATGPALTLATWFRTSSSTADSTLLSVTANSGNSMYKLQASGSVSGDPIQAISKQSSSIATATSTTGFSTNTWHHACARFVSNLNRWAYIDGGSGGQNTNLRSVSGLEAVMGMAAFESGVMAEAGIWNVALTTDEVALLAAGYSPLLIRPTSLVFYVPLIRELVAPIGVQPAFTINTPIAYPHPRMFYPPRRQTQAQSPGAVAWTLNLSDSVTPTDNRDRSTVRVSTDSITLTEAQINSLILAKSDTITLTDDQVKVLDKTQADTLTLTDAQVKDVIAARTDVLTLSDAQLASLGLSQSDTETLTDVSTRSPEKTLTDVVILADNLTLTWAFSFQLADAVGLSDSTERDPCKLVSPSILRFSTWGTYGDKAASLDRGADY